MIFRILGGQYMKRLALDETEKQFAREGRIVLAMAPSPTFSVTR